MVRVERVAEGGQPELVVEDGTHPAPFPDESAVLFLRGERGGRGTGLWKQSLGPHGAASELLPAAVFRLLGQPHVSPDGRRIAFAGSGEPSNTSPQGSCGLSARGSTAAPVALAGAIPSLLDRAGLAVRVAYAHGAPWDIWTIQSEGTGFRRAVRLQEDEPTVARSPSGSHLAVFGASALYVADRSGGQPPKLVEHGDYGGLDWTEWHPFLRRS